MFPNIPLLHDLIDDPKELFETLTTLLQSKEYRLRNIFSRIRTLFESQELIAVRWIPGTANYAEALTKRNASLSKQLNRMLREGIWQVQEVNGCILDSKQ